MYSAVDRSTYKILLAAGNIPADVLDRAVKTAEAGKQSFWKGLAESSGLGESGLYDILSKQTGVPLVLIKKIVIDPKAREKVSVKIAWYYKFFPYKLEDGKVWVAVSQIPDVSVLDEIRFGIGIDVMVALAPEKDIEEMLNKHYGLGADMVNKIISQTPDSAPFQTLSSTHQVEDIENGDDIASVAQLVNQIILEAYKKRASDIHLEPYRGKVRLRYRIDGVLHEASVHEEMKKFFSSILSRIKIMSNLNVVEKRLPQDGKMRVKTADQNLDLRVSSIPTAHGESMVIRLLTGKNVWSLDSLGFNPTVLSQIKSLLQKPNGIIFATGPTGSGKSTTLYGCLTSLNSEERKIITIEDPVEYELEGISQIQVASDIGLGFSQGLRSVLRHDPDVLMVGEVRDLETADISIRAALTGHLILSTLHTNDAASGITRLTDIGVQRYLIASSVIAFIAQRLVRLICPKCREPHGDLDLRIREEIMTSLSLLTLDEVKTFRSKGCEYCNGSGYSGRQAIHEVLIINDEMRKLIMDGATAGEIKKRAMLHGMKSLRQDGFRKVLQGLTTAEEIMRVAPTDSEEEMPLVESGEDAVYLTKLADQAANTVTVNRGGQVTAPTDEYPESKRKFKRITVPPMDSSYRIVESNFQHPRVVAMKEVLSSKNWSALIENISAGGLLLCSSESMNLRIGNSAESLEITAGEATTVGSVIELQIHLLDGEKPVSCIGRVLRVTRKMKKVGESNQFVFNIAVLFLVINSHDRLRIETFCSMPDKK